jgi:hypothetical protein
LLAAGDASHGVTKLADLFFQNDAVDRMVIDYKHRYSGSSALQRSKQVHWHVRLSSSSGWHICGGSDGQVKQDADSSADTGVLCSAIVRPMI